jgi:hypothetical protein
MAILASAGFFFSATFCFLEGAGLVAEAARVRMFTAMAANIANWIALASGLKLAAIPVVSAITSLGYGSWMFLGRGPYFRGMWCTPPGDTDLSWRAEVWPFQWKIALSWLSGYFVFQLATPVLFKYRGAVTAGQMGMTGSIVVLGFGIAMAWVSTKAPHFGMLIARGHYGDLDRLFFRSLKQSVVVAGLAGAAMIGACLGVQWLGLPFASRILGPLPVALMVACGILNQVTGSFATYLRAHKREPYLALSIIAALLLGGSTVLVGAKYGVTALTAANLTLTGFVLFPYATYVFLRKRTEWHDG